MKRSESRLQTGQQQANKAALALAKAQDALNLLEAELNDTRG